MRCRQGLPSLSRSRTRWRVRKARVSGSGFPRVRFTSQTIHQCRDEGGTILRVGGRNKLGELFVEDGEEEEGDTGEVGVDMYSSICFVRREMGRGLSWVSW